MIVAVSFAGIFSCAVLLWVIGRLRGQVRDLRMNNADYESIRSTLRKENTDLLARGLKATVAAENAAKEAEKATEAAVQLGTIATMHKRRADEFFAIIEGVERERDQWQKIYRESSQGAGVAQGLLFRHLSAAVQTANNYAARLKKLGEKASPVVVDQGLQRILAEFEGTHGTPGEWVPGTPAKELAEKANTALLGESVATE